MITHIHPSEHTTSHAPRLLFDVRSPGEFAQGHIPGAVSLPLFSDEERAKVGTMYKQQGPEEALLLGLKFVGPKMAGFVRRVRTSAPGRQVAVHCWRGGQRSRSMGWLLDTAGFDVHLLVGGYKAYRQTVLEYFENTQLSLVVLGGPTGTGKTKLLRKLQEAGEQIVDLELLAHHKGSSFGSLGEAEQPTVEQFENDLHAAFLKLNPNRPIWLENESKGIGRVFLPLALWHAMQRAPLVHIEVPLETRLDNLVADYADADPAGLQAAFERLQKRLGGLVLRQALEALESKDYRSAAALALQYYDKTYRHQVDIRTGPVFTLQADTFDLDSLVEKCLNLKLDNVS